MAVTDPVHRPRDEGRRLAALERYEILDTPPEEAFERITRLAARVLDAPIALVSLVDRDRQWFKSCFGWDLRESARETSFCTHAIEQDEVLVVPDARLDPRFSGNPLVTGDTHIRFYAGAPLRTSEGDVLGTLCVLDTEPRDFRKDELQTLVELASVVVDELDLRLALSIVRKSEARTSAALRDAQEAYEARNRFLSSMSHELRTPLNAIIGFAQLLQEDDISGAQKEDVREIVTAARTLLKMINEIFAAAVVGDPITEEP